MADHEEKAKSAYEQGPDLTLAAEVADDIAVTVKHYRGQIETFRAELLDSEAKAALKAAFYVDETGDGAMVSDANCAACIRTTR